MISKQLCSIVYLLCGLSSSLLCGMAAKVQAQDSLLSKSDLISLDFSSLAAHKDRIRSHDPALMPAYDRLLKDAESCWIMPPYRSCRKPISRPAATSMTI